MAIPGSINPRIVRNLSNNPEQMLNYTMSTIMDNVYRKNLAANTNGSFKAVCLSGFETEDNSGGSLEAIDGQLSTPTDQGSQYISIIVRPLTPFGDILPNPTNMDDPEEIKRIIELHGSVFTAKADFQDSNVGIQYGEIVNCYFESGNITNSDFSGLRFSKPARANLDSVISALSSISGIAGLTGLDWNNAQLVSGGPAVIDPRYPPNENLYIGSVAKYKNQKLQNGNIPEDLLGRASQGSNSFPILLKEVVASYDAMALAFANRFPGKKLGASGYRTYAGQISVAKTSPNLAATPGTSNHGLGLAIDINYYENGSQKKFTYSSEEYKWLVANGPRIGWYNPPWALQGQKKQEPWHWESVHKNKIVRGLRNDVPKI